MAISRNPILLALLLLTGCGKSGPPYSQKEALKTFQIDPAWRIYGRSSSDDKSPIVAFVAAIDALDASNVPLTSNVRLIVEGDENPTVFQGSGAASMSGH